MERLWMAAGVPCATYTDTGTPAQTVQTCAFPSPPVTDATTPYTPDTRRTTLSLPPSSSALGCGIWRSRVNWWWR